MDSKHRFKTGEIVCMNAAGGWGYNPKDNRLLALVTEVTVYHNCSANGNKNTHAIGGYLLEETYDGILERKFHCVPVYERQDGEEEIWTVLPATQEQIDRLEIEEIEI